MSLQDTEEMPTIDSHHDSYEQNKEQLLESHDIDLHRVHQCELHQDLGVTPATSIRRHAALIRQRSRRMT